MPQPSLRTVAQAAGVSVSSVSNAYNRPDQLSAEVRSRILNTARELGYAGPDPAARSLRTRHVGAIGVLFSTPLEYAFADPYCVELMRGVSEVLAAHRTHLVLVPQADAESAKQLMVDAVIADGLEEGDAAIQAIIDRGLPVALSTESTVGSCAFIDDRAAGRLIGEHLADRGLSDVTVVVGTDADEEEVTTNVDEAALLAYSRLRLAGIRDGLGNQARVAVVGVGGNRLGSGAAAAEAILRSGQRPAAIAADSDVLAVGVAQALGRHGLQVGEDIAVTGFDDLAIAAQANITTVRQPIREKGRTLAATLLDPDQAGSRTVLDTVLVPRASTEGAAGTPQPREASPTVAQVGSPPKSEWGIGVLDLDAYLDRIGFEGSVAADLATLRAVHRAHIASIPFENLELMAGRAISMDLEAIQHKLVLRRRGGYCYEQNLLMAAVLERLGFTVDRWLARTGDPLESPRPRSHLIVTAQVGDARWLVDVGFGSGLLEPIPLSEGGATTQGEWTFAVTRGTDEAWRLRELRAGKWSTRYTFIEERLYPVDVEGANHVTSTSASSPFVQRPILVGRDEHIEKALIGREFTTADAERDLSHAVLSDDQLDGVLREHFGLHMSNSDVEALLARLT